MHPGRSESRAPQPCGRHGRWMRRSEDSERQRCPEVPCEGPSSCGRPPALLPTPDGLAAPRGRGLPRSQNARRETTRRTRAEAVFPFPSPFGLLEVARQPGLCSTCLASFSRGPFPHADLAGAVQEGCGRPSPPLPSPRAGPRLHTRVPVPGRAGGVVPAVAFRSRGRARHVLRGLRVCMRVQSTALPPRSPRPWATPVLCSRGRGLGGRPGARLCVPTVPSGACWRVASLVGSHPGGSCVLQADQ